MGKTTIAWTDFTLNFWIGCREVGPLCGACYARELDRRYQFGIPQDQATANRAAGIAPHWGVGAPRHRTSRATTGKVRAWNKAAEAAGVPAKVFCNSLSDFFDNEIDPSWREDAWADMRATPWLRWIVLTKRPPNIKKMLPKDWGERGYPNVGLMASVGDQDEFERDAPRLLAVPARWHGFSMEPQIGSILTVPLLKEHRGSVWAITGGMSRQGYFVPRGYNVMNAYSLVSQRAVLPNLRVFVKQTGAHPYGGADTISDPRDGAGENPEAWPAWMRVREFPPEWLS